MDKPDCKDHKTSLPHYGKDWKALARDLGDLRYKELAGFLDAFSRKILKDAEKDHEAGRTMLGDALFNAWLNLAAARRDTAEAWRISKPFM